MPCYRRVLDLIFDDTTTVFCDHNKTNDNSSNFIVRLLALRKLSAFFRFLYASRAAYAYAAYFVLRSD